MKDRLPQLQQIIEDTSDDYELHLVNDEQQENRPFLQDFFSQVNTVKDSIADILHDVDEIRKKHNTILTSPYSGEQAKEELDDLINKVSLKAKRVKSALKEIEKEIEIDNNPTEDRFAENRIKQCQYATLSREFIEVMANYNKMQIEYKEGCKSRIKRQLIITKQAFSDEQIEEMIDNQNSSIFTQGIITDTQEAKQSLRDIEARHNDIIKLENSIKELHALFTDLAIFVENQGEMIDRIEFNVDQASEYVISAVNDTKKAIIYQSRARRKKIIVGVLIIIVLTVVILIAVLVRK